jgi:2-oxo-hept-3-ene-1,7-dioate hydratase
MIAGDGVAELGTTGGQRHSPAAASAAGGGSSVIPEHEIADVARRLESAERTRTQMALLSMQYPGAGLAQAYAIQRHWMQIKMAAGRRVVGHKVGLTSRAMQVAVGIDTPDSGVLLDDMVFEDGSTIPGDRFIMPRIEAELAFILRDRLCGPDVTMYDVLESTAYVTPALEILDTRIFRSDPATGRARTVFDTVADNAANAGVVLGGQPMRSDRIDLRWSGAILHRNGVIEETGLAAGVLNHPARAVAWLCNRLAAEGAALEAGHIVLSGSFIRPVEAARGDVIQADFGPLGSVTCRFG